MSLLCESCLAKWSTESKMDDSVSGRGVSKPEAEKDLEAQGTALGAHGSAKDVEAEQEGVSEAEEDPNASACSLVKVGFKQAHFA